MMLFCSASHLLQWVKTLLRLKRKIKTISPLVTMVFCILCSAQFESICYRHREARKNKINWKTINVTSNLMLKKINARLIASTSIQLSLIFIQYIKSNRKIKTVMFMLFPLFSLTYVPHGLAYMCLFACLWVNATSIQTVNVEFVEPISSIYDWMKWSLLIKMQHQNITPRSLDQNFRIFHAWFGWKNAVLFIYIFFYVKYIIDQALHVNSHYALLLNIQAKTLIDYEINYVIFIFAELSIKYKIWPKSICNKSDLYV